MVLRRCVSGYVEARHCALVPCRRERNDDLSSGASQKHTRRRLSWKHMHVPLLHTRSPMDFGLLTVPATCVCWTSEGRLLLNNTSCHVTTFGRSNSPIMLWMVWFQLQSNQGSSCLLYTCHLQSFSHIFKARSLICERRLLASTGPCVRPHRTTRLPLGVFSLKLIIFSEICREI
jgi:hypothetical protein